jgi:hypothetical protein
MSNRFARFALAAIAVMMAATPAFAQIMLPTVERRAVEFGYDYKWFDREATSGPVDQLLWEVASLYGRYGAFGRLTILAEGGLWSVDDRNIDDRSFTRWVVGGGATLDVYRHAAWSVAAAGAFSEVYDHDNDFQSDQRTRSWNVSLWAQVRFGSGAHRLALWAGPVFVDDVAQIYAWGAKDPLLADTDATVGGLAGVSGVLFWYVSGFASVTYVENAQLRLGIAVRSRGVEP